MILLAPGASGGIERVLPTLRALTERGLDGQPVALPRGSAERALPAYRAALAAAISNGAGTVIGGQSFGGRVASLLAVEPEVRDDIAGLVLLSYPLHAPGREPAWDERTAHWPAIRCPVLLLSGEADPFARIARLRAAVTARLGSRAQLHTYPGIGHSLRQVHNDVVERISAFVQAL